MKTIKKFFTPAEANKTLPLVKQIVKDILHLGGEIRNLSEESDTFSSEDPAAMPLIRQLNAHFEELEGIGCSYRDWNFRIGLVDFPARMDGNEVLLCWRSDEDQVIYYHGVHDGYAGRKPIPAEFNKV